MPEENFQCQRCGSSRFVSISLDGGYTRRPQCVPCGRVDSRYFGHGWKSSKRDSGWTRHLPPGT
jgi:hypothetical protein